MLQVTLGLISLGLCRHQLRIVWRNLQHSINTIVICSAKCSNAKEFEPFAATLDEETMLYGRDEHFDFDAWQHSLESPRRGTDKLTIDLVLDSLPLTGSIPKAVVIERLRDKGIGEKRSREFISANLAPLGPVHEWHIKRSGKRH